MNKVANISERRQAKDDPVFSALEAEALEISQERDETEREIKRLAESGFKDEAWKLLVKHLNITEPRRLKIAK